MNNRNIFSSPNTATFLRYETVNAGAQFKLAPCWISASAIRWLLNEIASDKGSEQFQSPHSVLGPHSSRNARLSTLLVKAATYNGVNF